MKTKQLLLTALLCVLCTAIQSQSLSVPELLKYLEKRSPAIGRKLKKKGFNVRTYSTREGYHVLFGGKAFNNNHQEKVLEEKKRSSRYTFQYEVEGNRSLLPAYIQQIETEGFALSGLTRSRYKTSYYKKISSLRCRPKQLEILVLDYGDQFVLYFKKSNVRLKAIRGDKDYQRRFCLCRVLWRSGK